MRAVGMGAAAAALAIGLAGPPAAAHDLAPALAEIEIVGDATLRLTVDLNLEALIARIGPEHDNAAAAPQAGAYLILRDLPPDALAARFDAREQAAFLGDVAIRVGGAPLDPRVASVEVPPIGDKMFARDSRIVIEAVAPRNADAFTFQWAARLGAIVIRPAADPAAPLEPVAFAEYVDRGGESAPMPLFDDREGLDVLAGRAIDGAAHLGGPGLAALLAGAAAALGAWGLTGAAAAAGAFAVGAAASFLLAWLALDVGAAFAAALAAGGLVAAAAGALIAPGWRPPVIGALVGAAQGPALAAGFAAAAPFAGGSATAGLGFLLGSAGVAAIAAGAAGAASAWAMDRFEAARSFGVVPAAAALLGLGSVWLLRAIDVL